MSKAIKKFQWTPKKLNIARTIAEGIRSQRDIAREFDITEETISRWKQAPEFMEKVDEFTLAHEKATKAGLLREAYKGLAVKEKKIKDDKSTHLDYVKTIADIQGHSKQTVRHEGIDTITVNISHEPRTED